jgi:hypothetical protein
MKSNGVRKSKIINNLYGFDIDKIAVLLAKINIYLLICETERIIIIIPTGGENEEARERYKGHDYATGAGFFL